MKPKLNSFVLVLYVCGMAYASALEIDTNAWYRIRPAHTTNRYLDVEGGPAAVENGHIIHQFHWWNGANQKWRFRLNDDGKWSLWAKHSKKYLDVKGGPDPAAFHNYATVYQWEWTGAANQKWDLRVTQNDHVRFYASDTAFCLDVKGGPGATAKLCPLQLYHDGGGLNQEFILEKLPPPPPGVDDYDNPTVIEEREEKTPPPPPRHEPSCVLTVTSGTSERLGGSIKVNDPSTHREISNVINPNQNSASVATSIFIAMNSCGVPAELVSATQVRYHKKGVTLNLIGATMVSSGFSD